MVDKVVTGATDPIDINGTYVQGEDFNGVSAWYKGTSYAILFEEEMWWVVSGMDDDPQPEFYRYDEEVNGAYLEILGTGNVVVSDAAPGTNFQINKDDVWKEVTAIKINVDDAWKSVDASKLNVDDAWKEIF